MSAVSLTAVGQLKGQTAPYSLASITGTVYDSSGATFTIPATKSLVFFRGKTFTAPYTVPSIVNPISPVAGNGEVTLSWSAPDNGGSSITGYTVKHANGTVIITTTNTSYTVTSLTNGTSYTFIVIANNSVGSSSPSSSPSATPVAPVNDMKITSVRLYNIFTGEPFGNNIITTPVYNYNYGASPGFVFIISGGNSAPIYITFRTSSFNGTTIVRINNVDYGNDGNLSVYFPYGISSAAATHINAPNGGSLTISQTRPADDYLSRRCQDANGNNITCP